MELEDLMNSNPELTPEELLELGRAARQAGKILQVTYVDDPGSPEGLAAKEYVNSHHWLPENYRTLPPEEVERLGRALLDKKSPVLERKKALMLLGHRGSIEAYRILKHFVRKPPPELKVWAEMAFDECKTFLASELTDDIKSGANFILSKVGRNSPCPCGSGKKYKHCCGKR
jgi:hypothetical protein